MKKKSIPLTIRILIIVFLIVYILCWLYTWILLISSQNKVLDKSFDLTINDQNTLCNNIKTFSDNMLTLTNQSDFPPSMSEIIKNAVITYESLYFKDTAKYRIMDTSGKEIHSNMDSNIKQSFNLQPPNDGTTYYELNKIDNNSYIYVSSYITINNQKYKIDYAENITESINDQQTFAKTAFFLLIIISLILSIALYFSIHRTLKPLRELGKQVRTISQGDYSYRVKISRYDEVGKLAEDFNHMADAVEKQTMALKEAAELRELYAANLAHEIKTPITSIIGYTDIAMMTQPNPDKLYEMLTYINKEGKRLDELSYKLLQWSNINNNHHANIKQIKTDKMLNHIKMMTQDALNRKNQSLIIHNNLECIKADESLLITLIKNLIINAVNASDINNEIELSLNSDDQDYIIIVKDHGIGIDKAELSRIKEPFYMIDKNRSRANQGAGLGLALCDAIVKAHNGSLIIDSQKGIGTIVTVKIPL